MGRSKKKVVSATFSKRKPDDTKYIKSKPTLKKNKKKSSEKRNSRKGVPILKIDKTGHVVVGGVNYYVGKHDAEVIYRKDLHCLQSAKFPNIKYALLEARDVQSR